MQEHIILWKPVEEFSTMSCSACILHTMHVCSALEKVITVGAIIRVASRITVELWPFWGHLNFFFKDKIAFFIKLATVAAAVDLGQ